MATTGRSQYLSNAILNWMRGTTFPAAPANTYVALFTTNPTDDAGAGAVEVSGGSYARIAVASGNWGAPSGGLTTPATMSNGSIITFATPTANWGTVIGIGLYDAVTAGNFLYWNSITSQVINTGVVPSFAVAALIVTDE